MKQDTNYRQAPCPELLEAEPLAAPDEEALLREADDAQPETRELSVDAAHHGHRLDRLLVGLAPEFSRSHLQRLVHEGHVRVDGSPVNQAARKVRAGERISVTLHPTAEALAFRPEPMALEVVHQDDQVLVVDKPAGLVVHPAPGHWSGTLLNGVLHRDPGAARLPRAGIVHRLDKDTSGLMVIGRTLEAVTHLVRQIAAREATREYLALAYVAQGGAVPSRVEAPIGRDPRSRLRMAVVAGGKPARTDFQEVGVRDGVVALRCALHTGRTHQIRVHLAHAGHPLVADALYGGRQALRMERHALHAARLAFTHPTSGERLTFEREPPRDFRTAWDQVIQGGSP